MKCEFHEETVSSLAVIISTKGISIDEDNVETVRTWSWETKTMNGRLSSLFERQQLCRFCNYY